MGRLDNAELVEKDGYYYVEADYLTFDNSELVSWNMNYVIVYFNTAFQFAEVEPEEVPIKGRSTSEDTRPACRARDLEPGRF